MRKRLTHLPSGTVLADDVVYATSWPARARGLIGKDLATDSALVLVPGKQVHTFFMSRPIDVVFCDQEWKVLHVVSPLRQWRVSRWVAKARYVIELPAGVAAAVKIGDRIDGEG